MKKYKKTILMSAMTGVLLCSCGSIVENQETESSTIINKTTEILEIESSTLMSETTSVSEMESSILNETTKTFEKIENLENLQFFFSSGAGGWATTLTVNENGSFSGEYYDGEMGLVGEEYPNGTMYKSNFTGKFTSFVKINDYTYETKIQELNYENPIGKEEIQDGVKICYTDAYGIEGAETIFIYLIGAPLKELPEGLRNWIGYADLSSTTDTELPFVALYNEKQECGFSSSDIMDDLKTMLDSTQQESDRLQEEISKESLTQTEYNQKTQQLYEMWDSMLNETWSVLKKKLKQNEMESLTADELEWISWKEKEIVEAGKEYEGGTMQAMVTNSKAAELTKQRVYELLEMLE